MVKLSEAQRDANDKYIMGNYSQVKLSMPIKESLILDYYLKENNIKSKAGFIRDLIKEKIGDEKWKSLEEEHKEAIENEIKKKQADAEEKIKKRKAKKKESADQEE